MKLNPTLDKVIVKKCDYNEITNSGIFLVNESKDNMNKLFYEVVEVGPGGIIAENVEIEMVVKPGDRVLVEEYVGSEIEINGEFYRIIKQNNILAIVEK